MKWIYEATIACLLVATSTIAQQTDSTLTQTSSIDNKQFYLESIPIADKLDSLFAIHFAPPSLESFPADYDSLFIPEVNDSLVKYRLAKLDAQTPLSLDYNPVVKRFIDMYVLRRRNQVSRMLGLANYYFPMFEEVLDRYNMPLELKYLAVVESALNPKARSRVGATGLWQFMYGTGKIMGLKTSSYVDERSDPYKSTVAACEYMLRMYKMFGDWNLVLAAYNSGPGNVNKAIRRSGGKTSYWQLRPYLPRETAGYVPAFIAATYTMNFAAEHNIFPSQIAPHLMQTDTTLITQQLSFDQLSLWLGIDKEELIFLNPSYKLEIIPVAYNQKHYLVLPHDRMGLFVQNQDSLYKFAAAEFAKTKEKLPDPSQLEYTTHRVKSGENLGLIANRYNVSVRNLKRWNGLRSDMIRPGQRLKIYGTTAANSKAKKTPTKTTIEKGNTYYVVQKGDTLYDIAQKFNGVSSNNLAEWNNVNPNDLKPGMKLVVKKASP